MNTETALAAAEPAATVTSAEWVAGRKGRRWRTVWQPLGTGACGTVLFLPPLGDEMNHTRPLMAAAAQALAAAGWCVQCTDPCGTGDSDGDFDDASLAGWADDFADDARAAAQQGPWVLWAARQGALLLPALVAALAQRGVPAPKALAFWNPVWQGSTVLTQWLRLAALANVAAMPNAADAMPLAGAGVAALRQRLARGETVACGGYRLTPAFAKALETVQVAPLAEWARTEPWLAGVPVREWEAGAAGARRFWLPQEDATDTTLVAPLVSWLAGGPRATRVAEPVGLAGPAGFAGDAGSVNPAGATASGVPALSPLLLEVPPGASERCGVLFVVGGPQYRVGAHRQFVRWSRHFNAAGHATCRFDRAGTGDAPGARAGLLDCGAELRARLEQAVAISGVRRWVVFGLCDGASLGLLHLAAHPEVSGRVAGVVTGVVAGVVALNPWLPVSALQQSQALVSEYYGRQLFSAAFWRRLLRGEVKVLAALREWWGHRRLARSQSTTPAVAAGVTTGVTTGVTSSVTTGVTKTADATAAEPADATAAEPAVANTLATGTTSADARFSEAVLASAATLSVPMLWALSGNDRTAAEFRAVVASDARWAQVLSKPTATRLELPEADHTLSNEKDHDHLAAAVTAWLTRVA